MLLFSSVQFSRWVMPDSLQCHESQHARPPCPSPTLGVIVTRLDFSVLPPSKPSTQLQAFLQSLYHSLFILPLSPTFRFSLPKFLPPRHLFSVKHCLFSAVTLANSCPRLGLLGASVPVFLTHGTRARDCHSSCLSLSLSPRSRANLSSFNVCQCRRHRFNSWVRKTSGKGNGHPLQYSCLGNSMDRGA